MDCRQSWFARCINNVFGIADGRDAVGVLGEALDRDGARAKRRFVRFLEPTTAIGRHVGADVLYAYTTAATKTVREEIEVEEELSELEIQSLRESESKKKKKRHQPEKKKKKKHVAHAEDALTSGGDSPATDSDKDSDDGKSRDGYSSPDTAIQMADEDGMKKYSERLFKKVKVIQERTITLPELHVRFGRTVGDDLDADVRYLYFVKNTNSAIPVYELPEEADFYMPAHFLVGSKSPGCPVKAMEMELSEIWIPSVEKLLVDPFSHDCVAARHQKNAGGGTLASTCVPSTFVRISREIKAQREILVGERPDDYEERLDSVDLEKIISLSELFTLESSSFRDVNELASSEPLKQHFLMELRCLVDKLKWTIDYMSKKRSSNVTEYLSGLAEDNVDEIAITVERTPAMILQCVNTLENWISKMKNLRTSISESRERDTIHSEFTFWKDSETSVRSILDELESEDTKLFVDVIEKTANTAQAIKDIWDEFKNVKSQFERSCGLAKDNLKYISLIMEHYEDFISADFNTIMKIIPIWFDDLRTIWVLSPYFGKDVNMLRLLLQISNGLCENVGRNLGDLKSIFKTKTIEEISEMSYDATRMLDAWSAGYLETRKSIERSKFKRWEFDKCALFNKIEYIKRIARDIHEIVATISQFLNILGPELRSVIKDMIGLDVMISRVKSLYKVFDAIDFDLFCEDNVENWNLFLKEFHLEVLRVEEECKLFIDWCFNNLRSCKEAYSSLEKLQQFTSRSVFKEQLKTKYEAILRQYENELTTIETLFSTRQNDPPVSRHHPPVSGSIFWVRMLFDKIKEPITVFQSADEFDVPLKDKVVDMYKSIVDHMKRYERSKITDWTAEAKPLAVRQMNSNILAVRDRTKDDVADDGKGDTIKVEDFKDWLKCTGGPNKILSDGGLMFITNFDDRVYELIEEAETMEILGIVLPGEIQTLLAKKNSLLGDIMKVNNLVNMYNSFVSSMDDSELVILKHKLKEIEDYFYAGLCRYNWLSVSIASFTDDGVILINKTKNQFNNIKIVESHVSQLIASFENVNLFPLNILVDNDSVLMRYKMLHLIYERYGFREFRNIIANYRVISKRLIHLESNLFGSTSGACLPMSGLYSNYKDMIVNAILKMYSSNLEFYNKALLSDNSLVNLIVNVTDDQVTIVPNMYVAYNNIIRNVSKCLGWLSALPVWRDGSCNVTQHDDTATERKDGRRENTLYGVIINDGVIREKIETTRANAHGLMVKVNKYLKKWERFRFLWNGSKIKNTEFSITDTSIQEYENIFNDLNRLLLFFANMPLNKKIHCVKLDLSPMVNQMKQYTRNSMSCYADQLMTSTRRMMRRQGDVFDTFKTSMNSEITNGDEFYDYLYKIEEIRTEQVNVEIFFQNLNHRIYVLEKAGVTMPREDLTYVSYIQDDWTMLQQIASEKKLFLEKAKAIWSHTVKLNIKTFSNRVNVFLDNYRRHGSQKIENDLDAGLALMDEYDDDFNDLMRRKDKLVREEELFNVKLLDTETFDKCYSEFQHMKLVYSLYERQKSDIEKWSAMPWQDVGIEFVREIFGALVLKFKRLPVSARNTRPARMLANYLKELRLSVPILLQLKNDALKPRHWREMLNAIGVRFDDGDVLLFGMVLKMRTVKHKHTVETILNKAIDESDIERILNEINERWTTTSLDIEKHSNAAVRIEHKLRDVRNALQVLEDDQITMHKMMNSYSVEPFLSKVETWQKNLSTVNEVLNKWWFVQQKWIYLAEIYASNEIVYILPENAEQFNELNKVYKEVMANANRNSKILEQCLNPTIMNKLSWLECRLDISQKELNSYIIEKRNSFPRFYFISDNDLLFIYGNPDLFAIQKRIVQIFDNIKSLNYEFTDQSHAVTSMTTCNDEVLKFKNDVIIKNAVDKWMLKVIDQMQKSNRVLIKKAILDLGNILCSSSRCGWINSFPESVCLTADNVWWTVEVEHVLNEMNLGNNLSMKRYFNELNKKIDETLIQIKKEMSKNTRKKYSSVLILYVHHRDIVESFIINNVTSAKAFEWDSILKSYWLKNKDNLYIAQCSGVFDYGYEYMGSNNNVAVITPLTDRIFLTFTQALMMGLGGAANGPTGTGKTETILAMAKILGNLCKIVNCNDGLDHRTFSRVLNGICRSKIWGLFARFNRISRKTMSVISALLFSVKWALFENKNEINFRVYDSNMNPRVGIFITVNIDEMNGRRHDIDEVVKNHFRPAICLMPDFEQICFAVLYSEGFLEAKILSKKLSLLYKLCKEGLSVPLNQTFDLRSLKLVVKTARDLMTKRPELEEKTVVMTVLRDLNTPKLIDKDVPLFLSFMTDLFPNVKYFKTTNDDFNTAVEHALKREKFIRIDSQVEKINQIMEMLTSRNSIAIIGPTSGGKSAIVGLLRETFNHLKIPTKLIALNPKAFTKLELYGYADPVTKTWTDGLLTTVFRNINQPIVSNDQSTNYFVLFDGDVDSVWVDDLNPVMDDNKTLTLSNGEEIRIKPQCNLLFEVGHLTCTAPSTVSRMGIVYVDPDDLGYRPFWTRWLEQRSLIEQTALDQCFQKYVPALFDLIFGNENCKTKLSPLRTAVPQTKLNMTMQLCFVLDAILPLVSSDVGPSSEDTAVDRRDRRATSLDGMAAPLDSMVTFLAGVGVLEAVFIQALYLSPGALLADATARHAFDDAVKTLSGLAVGRDAAVAVRSARRHLKYIPCDQPTWYDYYLDFDRLEWVPWKNAVPEYVHDGAVHFDDILVPTAESTRLTWILELMNQYYFRSAIFKKVKRPTVVVGETSSGKTATMKHFIRNLQSKYYIKMALNFSAGTSSSDVQTNLETNLERHSRKTYGPPVGKRLVCFIDDLNLPRTDACGTRRPIALLRGIFDKQGMYGRRKRFDWKELVDVCFFGAMAPRGGHELDPRFLSLCTVFYLAGPADHAIRNIFGSILSGHAASLTDDVRSAVRGVVDATVRLYGLALEELRRTPEKFLYAFNMRHIGCVVSGMTRVSPGTFATAKSFVRVWRNEFTRTVCDRLVCRQDRETIERHLAGQLHACFPAHAEYALRDPLLFGDCRNAVNANDRRRAYEDLIDYDSAFHLFQEISLEYKTQHGPSDMILFDDALDHIIRIHRTLGMDRGHVSLIGSDGNGKKSLAKLAAFASGHEMCINSSFRSDHRFKTNQQRFKDDLKNIFSIVGIENRPVVFIIDKVNVIDEDVLEFINNVLINGFVPSLYSDQEENRQIVRRFKNTHKNVSDDITADVCWEMFMNNCLNNLHVVLLMSPDDNLRSIFRNYPGFMNKTYIDWIHQWPVEALNAVAEKIIINDQVIPDNYVNNVIEQCVYMHKSAEDYAKSFFDHTTRNICFTFKHLVDCTHMYKLLVERKSSLSLIKSRQIQNGIEKIDESKLELFKITETLVQQDKSIIQNNETCQNLQREINGTRVLVEEIISIVNDSTEKLSVNNEQIKNAKEQMNELIDETLPVLNATRTLANEINLEDLTEMKSLDAPPESAATLLECVAILKGLKDMSTWKNLCEMIEDANFLNSLQELDLNQIYQRQQTQVRTKLKFLKKTIDVEIVSKVEHSILNFVESVLNYCSMYHEIIPLKNKIEKGEQHCLDATLRLRDHEESLKNTRCALFELEKSLDDVSKKNIALIKENRLLKTKFEYADKLIKGLRSIHERWSADLENHNTLKNQIFGNCLLNSSFLIYAGPFSLEYRKQIIFNDWFNNIVRLQIPIDLNYKLENELIDDKAIYTWNSYGLPCDEYSIQNGILMTRSNRFPLCIDPHDQGFNWIVNHEKNNSLKVLSFADSDYIVHLRNAVEYGKSVVFIDFENMDLDLKDLLNRNIRSNSRNSEYIEIGDQKCNYHENFRLYLMTKQTNLKITTSVYSNTTVINCSITQKGLEDQLLDLVVGREMKELKDERDLTLETIYENKEKLNEYKHSFLLEIVNCAGPLIDNSLLSNKLEDIGSKIDTSSARHRSSVESMSAIDRSRDVYEPVAKRGALLYMALFGMKAIDPFYQFSIDWFVRLFADSIESATVGDTTPKRIANIIDRLTEDVFEFSCIGIYEKHNVLYLFQTACALDKDAGNLSDSELTFFIRGAACAAGFEKRNVKNPTTWLPDKSWQEVVDLSTNFERFSNLIEHIRSDIGRWEKWYHSAYPETTDTIPIRIDKYFNVLMLIRCFRTDRVYRAVENYIYQMTGVNNENCIIKKNINFELIHKKFANLTPCVVILNNGSDPAKDLTRLAEKNDITGPTFKVLSLGICEQNVIYSALHSAMDRGNWLIVQNCNFSVPFLRKMEYLLERANEHWHPNFRLWLILDEHSLQSKSLPVSLLLRSVKVIVEPSNNMKLCMQKALEEYDPQNDLENENPHACFKSLLYASLFLHGILSERKKYNKTGWSLPYNFELSDHVACRRIIAGCLRRIRNDDEVPWTALKHLIGEIVYGGKVIDRYDRRILSTYVDEYFGDFVFSPYQPFSFYNPGPSEHSGTENGPLGNIDPSGDLTGAVGTIPLSVGPEACGLNANAVFAYRDGLADRLWRDAAELCRNVDGFRDGNGNDGGRDETVKNVGAELLTSLPGPFDVGRVKTFHGDKCRSPNVVVLLRELDKYNALLDAVRDSLSQLAKVFLGKTEMNATLEELSACLYAGRVPDRWSKLSPQTAKPLASYVDHLLKRARQYSNWSQIREPLVMWLSGLHSPRSYLRSLIQLACRKYGWPMERTAFYTSVTRWTCESEVQREPDAGCYVTGLYLEGARWDVDARCLAECASRHAPEKLPILAVVPVETSQLKLSKNSITVPVYVTSQRGNATDDNCVFEANMNTTVHRSFWILRGVCVVMNSE